MDSSSSPIVRRGRGGRPRIEDAGDVDRRILDAAASLFLQRGFDATSCEQVVLQAGAGKASLYARYANKEELFAAVVRDQVERTLPPLLELSVDFPLQKRLEVVGLSILTNALQPEVVALMRVVLSIAHRMPDLARQADQISRNRDLERVALTIIARSTPIADEMDRAMLVAGEFLDIALAPLQIRALLGEDLDKLAGGVNRRIIKTVCLLAKGGRLDEWE